jgi:hypothetical protein
MSLRCREYSTNETGIADIIVRSDLYNVDKYPNMGFEGVAYMESGWQFYRALLDFNGLYLHSSAIEWEGKAYLFSGPSGMGKSTHTRLWQSIYPDARVFNDDKPALRRLDDRWFAYGTPWCGKDGININMKVPLAGICFLRRGQDNAIRRLSPLEASVQIISQTTRRFKSEERLDLLLSHVEKLVREIPVYELYCTPTADAARLSSETMRRGAEEVFL